MINAGNDETSGASAANRQRWIVVADNRSQRTDQPRSISRDGFRFRSLLVTLLAHRKFIVAIVAAFGLVTYLLSLAVPNSYTATAQLLPPQQNQPALSALAGRLGEVANLAGARDLLRNPGAIYTALLRSRTVATGIVDRLNLQQVYRSKLKSSAVTTLGNRSSIELSKDGVIVISVRDVDPNRAAAIANAYIEELRRLCDSLAVTGAQQRRVFFEKEAVRARANLADAEHELQSLQEHRRLLAPDQQVKALLAGEAELRSRIAEKQVQLQHLLAFRTPNNPEVIQTRKDLAALQAQVDAGGSTGSTNARDLPAAGLEYLRKAREVKYDEALLDALTRQVEAARIDESNEAVVLQTIDPAIFPDHKSSPLRRNWAMAGCLIGLLVALTVVMVRSIYGAKLTLRVWWRGIAEEARALPSRQAKEAA